MEENPITESTVVICSGNGKVMAAANEDDALKSIKKFVKEFSLPPGWREAQALLFFGVLFFVFPAALLPSGLCSLSSVGLFPGCLFSISFLGSYFPRGYLGLESSPMAFVSGFSSSPRM